MIFLHHEQNTPAWLEARRGRFTGSEFGKFVMRKDKTAEKAFQNNIDEKIGEEVDGDDCAPSWENYEMKRGKMLESSALAAYESHTGHEVEKVGLAIHETLALGFSADAMVNQRSFGLELKCPTGKIQWQRLREKIVPDCYLCQIHGSMFLMGCEHWDFFSWHPNMPALYLRVYRATFTEELGAGLLAFAHELETQKAALAAMKA